jgi:tRNA pseudouridine55 synthase
MFGFFNFNKPTGITSREVVDRVERRFRPLKAGHAGTLDPLAEGVLVVAVGQATRLISYVQQWPKRYVASFLFGSRSDTDDVEGQVEMLPDPPVPTRAQIDAVLPRFLGTIEQRPPDYSAVWVKGKRAYQLARQGQAIRLAKRPVTIHELQLLHYDYPRLELELTCGSGTYVRALGRDLAAELGTGAVMATLIRTAIGPFQIEQALSLDLLDTLPKHSFSDRLVEPAGALSFLPALTVSAAEAADLQTGRTIERRAHGIASEGVAWLTPQRLVAIVVPRDADRLRPKMNFPLA